MITIWAHVLTGDLVRGADGLAWLAHRRTIRERTEFALTRPDRGAPRFGRPHPAATVTLVQRGPDPVHLLIDVFPDIEILSTEE